MKFPSQADDVTTRGNNLYLLLQLLQFVLYKAVASRELGNGGCGYGANKPMKAQNIC